MTPVSSYSVGFSFSLYSSLLSSVYIHAALVVGPGASLSMLLVATPNGEMPVGECPGRPHGNSGIQLRPDGSGARPLSGGRLRAERLWFSTAMDSKLWDSHICITDSAILILIVFVNGMFHLVAILYKLALFVSFFS